MLINSPLVIWVRSSASSGYRWYWRPFLNFLPELGGSVGDAAANPVAASTQVIENIAILVLTQLLYAIIYVAVTRQALGLRQGTAMVHFALGPRIRMLERRFCC